MTHSCPFILCELAKEFWELARVDLGVMFHRGRAHHRRSNIATGVASAPLGCDAISEDFSDMIANTVGHFDGAALFDLTQLGKEHHRVNVRNWNRA